MKQLLNEPKLGPSAGFVLQIHSAEVLKVIDGLWPRESRDTVMTKPPNGCSSILEVSAIMYFCRLQ